MVFSRQRLSRRLPAAEGELIVRARAPLRLGLAGGGSDVSPYCDEYGGAVLNVTISKYAYATAQLRNDQKVVFVSNDLDIVESFEIGETPKIQSLKLHYGVYDRIVRDFNEGRPIAMTLTTEVEAPLGSGLGSSSAVVVAACAALCEVVKVGLGEYDLAQLAWQIERNDLGLAGGKQDQYASTFGGFNFMEFGASNRVVINPLRVRSDVLRELEASILLVFTGASRQSANIIDAQTRSISSGGESLDAMHQLKGEATAMKEAVLFADFAAMGQILARGWDAKKRTTDAVSSPSIEQLFEVALGDGALAGKLSGAGGGGFAMFLVEPRRRAQLARRIQTLNIGTPEAPHLTTEGATTWSISPWV